MATSEEVILKIAGDSASAQKALNQLSADFKKLAGTMKQSFQEGEEASKKASEKEIANSKKAADAEIKESKRAAKSQSEKSSGGIGEFFKGHVGAFAGATAGALGLTIGLGMVYEAYEKVEEESAITNARLKATGDASGMTKQSIDALAHSLQNKTAIDENQIHATENMLLGYTNVTNKVGQGNDIFNRATSMSLNLSTALGIQGPQAARMLGMALQDPQTGLTRLSRAGVIFTKAQKTQIATMEKSGNIMGAQKYILDSLQARYGGVAKAAGDTTAGKLKIFMLNMRELGEKILDKVMPALAAFSDFLISDVLPASQRVGDWISTHIVPAFKKLKSAVQKSVDFIKQHWDEFKVLFLAGGIAIGIVLGTMAVQWGISAAAAMASAVTMAAAWLIATGPIALVIAGVALVAALIITHWTQIKKITLEVWHKISDTLKSVWNKIKSSVTAAVTFVFNLIKTGFTKIKNTVLDIVNLIKNFIITFWNDLKSIVTTGLSDVYNFFLNGWNNIKNSFTTGISDVVGFMTDLPGKIINAVSSAWDKIKQLGSDLLHKMLDGIIDALKDVGSIASKIKDAVVNAVKSVFGISSPSRVMAELGTNMSEGLINGLLKTDAKKFVEQTLGSLWELISFIPGLASKLGGALWGALGSLFGGGGDSGKQIPTNILNWIMTALHTKGVKPSGEWIAGLAAIIQNESGGNPNAINLTDSNAKRGDPSEGLMQNIASAYPSRVAGTPYAGTSPFDPVGSIVAGITYILGRYGNIMNVPGLVALTHHHRYVGYAGGGSFIVDRPTAFPQWGAVIGESGAERVSVTRLDGRGYQESSAPAPVNVQINVASGMEWLRDLIHVEVNGIVASAQLKSTALLS